MIYHLTTQPFGLDVPLILQQDIYNQPKTCCKKKRQTTYFT